MATFRAKKVNTIGVNKLLCALVACIVLCVSVISMFPDLLTVENHKLATSPENIKVIERVDPLTSVLKEGNELYIKEANGHIKKINEVIRVDDGIKIPQEILEGFEKMENMIDSNTIGKNFNQVKVQNVPLQKLNFVENVSDPIEMHKNIITQIEEQINKDKVNNYHKSQDVENTESEHKCQIEPTATTETSCGDSDIEKLISESIINYEQPMYKPLSCNLATTESEIQEEILSSQNKTKYMLIYLCLLIPLFFVYYVQRKRFTNENYNWNLSNRNICYISSFWNNELPTNKVPSTNPDHVNY